MITAPLQLLLGLFLVAGAAADVLPFWPQYPTRTVGLLNGRWTFGYKDNVPDVINFNVGGQASWGEGALCGHERCHLQR